MFKEGVYFNRWSFATLTFDCATSENFATAAVMGFYFVPLSDSSAMYFPENKISEYTTKLPCEIVLDGEWECGLAEVHYPLTFTML